VAYESGGSHVVASCKVLNAQSHHTHVWSELIGKDLLNSQWSQHGHRWYLVSFRVEWQFWDASFVHIKVTTKYLRWVFCSLICRVSCDSTLCNQSIHPESASRGFIIHNAWIHWQLFFQAMSELGNVIRWLLFRNCACLICILEVLWMPCHTKIPICWKAGYQDRAHVASCRCRFKICYLQAIGTLALSSASLQFVLRRIRSIADFVLHIQRAALFSSSIQTLFEIRTILD